MTWIAGLTTAVAGVFKFVNYRQQLQAAQTQAERELLLMEQKNQQTRIIIMGVVFVLMIIVIGAVMTAKIKSKA